MTEQRSIVVIGGGVAGIVAAYLLSQKHTVTILEQEARLGGHTNTIELQSGPDAGVGIDTGFIVLNDKNYPLFHRFLKRLDVPVRWSDMSFSYYSEVSGLQYAGTNPNGLFADRKNLLRRDYWAFLYELVRFCSSARKELHAGSVDDVTLGEYLSARGYSQRLLEDYLLPMGAAIWSAPQHEMLAFPAISFLRFFDNHGLLSVQDRPRWQTVVGGSQSYVRRFAEIFKGTIRSNARVRQVRRHTDSIQVELSTAEVLEFDTVVFASHADQTLAMIEAPSAEERAALVPWSYALNRTVLHTDESFLPPKRAAWASWNYLREKTSNENTPVAVTYHMNRLQGVRSPQNYCVTLNSHRRPRPDSIIYEIDYMHPMYSTEAIRSQQALPQLNGKQHSYFCGSYFGYGFHEDAVRSAVAVASHFGVSL